MSSTHKLPLDPPTDGTGTDTAGSDYTARLIDLQTARWKTLLDVQRPYRWNLRRLTLGRCLDVGCGVGRNLLNLGGSAVGVDHNAASVAVCRSRGFEAYTTDEFVDHVGVPASFDSMLIAHVLEHVDAGVGDDIIRDFLPFLKPGAKVVIITPQEVGYRSDSTHVRWVDHEVTRGHADRTGLVLDRSYSFPFPRLVGKVFIYNEFVTVMHVA